MAKKNAKTLAGKLRKRALSYPDTREDFPWGESAFKAKGKTFVFMHADDKDISFSVKLPSSRDFALTLPGSEPTHYGLGQRGWVTLRPLDAGVEDDILFTLVDESYRAITAKKPAKKK
jgi:predicted DNA-binding protein (MmcQ/YjbR family)